MATPKNHRTGWHRVARWSAGFVSTHAGMAFFESSRPRYRWVSGSGFGDGAIASSSKPIRSALRTSRYRDVFDSQDVRVADESPVEVHPGAERSLDEPRGWREALDFVWRSERIRPVESLARRVHREMGGRDMGRGRMPIGVYAVSYRLPASAVGVDFQQIGYAFRLPDRELWLVADSMGRGELLLDPIPCVDVAEGVERVIGLITSLGWEAEATWMLETHQFRSHVTEVGESG